MKKLLLTLATVAVLTTATAQAAPIRLDGSETNLQQIVNGVALDGSSSVNVVTDQYGLDESWQINSIFGARAGS